MYENMKTCVPAENNCCEAPTPHLTVKDCVGEIYQHMNILCEMTREIGLQLYADELHPMSNAKEITCLQDVIEDILNKALIIEDNIGIIKGRLGI